WSRTFDWGYFTKPPMVAWAIAATTSIFGNAEWAVRLAAPLAHAVTAIFCFLIGRSMFGAWAGFWAGFGWLTIPGVFFSSNIISTDVFLLPCWAAGLYAFWRLINTRAWIWAIAVGVAIGLGLQAKYAMLYFPACMVLAALWVKPARDALTDWRWVPIALIALAIFSPNIIWNIQNGFVTATHTAENLDVNPTRLFNINELTEFLIGQMLVIGPLIFAALIGQLWRAARRAGTLSDEDKLLLAFVLPALAVVTTIAFVTRANANWAVVSFVAAIVWVAGRLVAEKAGRRWLAGAVALNIAIGAVVTAAPFAPELSAQFKNVRASLRWEETAREIALRAATQPGEAPFTAVLVDDRATYFALTYYWREARRAGAPLPPVRMWLLHGYARNSAESTDPMRAEESGRVLVVHSSRDYIPFVAADFSTFRTVERLTVPLGGDYNRELEISVAEGFQPAPRDAAFRQRLLEMQGRR
ncbi:MAG TPA: glycosyltransferase family 39 protein, partial [Terricaulis sp.]|nr:glycosyltransferase family 39 protein [Terricaulis sp.]